MFLSNKNSSKVYYIYFKNEFTGKYTRISTKTKFKTDALQFLTEFKNSLKENNERRIYKGAVYLKDVEMNILNYIDNNFTKSTFAIYKNALKHFKDYFGNTPLNSINPKQIEEFKSHRSNAVNKTTCNIDLKTLKTVFNILIQWNMLKENPVIKVKRFKIPEKIHLCFSDNDIKLILNNVKNDSFKNLVSFALLTGCRISEILNIQNKDIDLANRVISISNKEGFKTKSGKNRVIPVSDNLNELLKSMLNLSNGKILNWINPNDYLFNNNGFKLSRNLVTLKFKRLLRELDIDEKFHFHCLRHTFITNLIKSGVNINYIKEIVGHLSIQTTMNYIHITTNDLRNAVNNINII